MKFFYKVDGEHFETPSYYKDYAKALCHMIEYVQRLGYGNEALEQSEKSSAGISSMLI